MKAADSVNWQFHYEDLSRNGFTIIRQLVPEDECEELRSLYFMPDLFRSIIDMKRYRFGLGEYKYFKYPLPKLIQRLRREFYPPLSMVANEWMKFLQTGISFPGEHSTFIQRCEQHKQIRPTPLILRYEEGGYNTLHQDLYGEIYFPFQMVIPLTQLGKDHTGGELVFTEQIPRAQSKAKVITPDMGDAVIFTTNFRPVQGTRGFYRAGMKHGVSEVTSGERMSLGIIFHDAL